MSSIPTPDDIATAFRARDWSEGAIEMFIARRSEPSVLKMYQRVSGVKLPRRLITPKAKIPETLRQWVLLRDGYSCVHCGATERLECDHIIPESRGGATAFWNLQALCRSCNARKKDRYDG